MKLTAADVQALRAEPDFQGRWNCHSSFPMPKLYLEGQHIYFYLNHPIRYVRLVGVVVAIDDINLKYTVLTIDDGSGTNVEVKIIRAIPDVHNPVDSSSNTAIENVNIISRFGIFEVMVDRQPLNIGTIIKAKCTISEFRDLKQLEMKRVWIVSDTNEEAQAWTETAAFKRKVLSVPWHISSAEHKRITKEIKMEQKRNREYEQVKMEHTTKRKEQKRARENHMAQREKRLEARRRKEEVMMNAGALI